MKSPEMRIADAQVFVHLSCLLAALHSVPRFLMHCVNWKKAFILTYPYFKSQWLSYLLLAAIQWNWVNHEDRNIKWNAKVEFSCSSYKNSIGFDRIIQCPELRHGSTWLGRWSAAKHVQSCCQAAPSRAKLGRIRLASPPNVWEDPSWAARTKTNRNKASRWTWCQSELRDAHIRPENRSYNSPWLKTSIDPRQLKGKLQFLTRLRSKLSHHNPNRVFQHGQKTRL